MPRGTKDRRLTWEETYRATAREKEDWIDFDTTLADGLEPATAMLVRRLISEMYGE